MCAYRVPDLDAQLDVCRPRTVCAAEKVAADFDPVPNNLGFAVLTDRREALNRTFKGVEDVHVAAHGLHLKGQPVVIAAYFAHSHNTFCPTKSHHASGSAAMNIIHGRDPTGADRGTTDSCGRTTREAITDLRNCEPRTRPRPQRSRLSRKFITRSSHRGA